MIVSPASRFPPAITSAAAFINGHPPPLTGGQRAVDRITAIGHRRLIGEDPQRRVAGSLWGETLHLCARVVTCETPTGPADIAVQYRATGAVLGIPDPVETAIQQIAPATAMVRAYGAKNAQWSGSAAIIDPKTFDPALAASLPPHSYLLLTNHHVANGAEHLTAVLHDGTEITARPLRSRSTNAAVQDAIVDAAVLVINAGRPIATATLATADQMAALRQGDTVITAGFPAGLPELTITKGVISQPKQQTGFTPFFTIQVDAAINGGNSGGPLVLVPDPARGRHDAVVIGLNTFTLRDREAMSFAMPVTGQLTVLRDLYQTGEHVRGDLGITWRPFPLRERELEKFPGAHGARIGAIDQTVLKRLFVAPLGFAPMAGDVVTSITTDGTAPFPLHMHSPYQATYINAWIQRLAPDTRVRMHIYRKMTENGQTVWREFTVGMTVRKLGDLREDERLAIAAAARNGAEQSAVVYLRAA